MQEEYNREHGITPETIQKAIRAGIEAEAAAHAQANAAVGRTDEAQYITEEYLAELEAEMFAAAEALEFERAAPFAIALQKCATQWAKRLAKSTSTPKIKEKVGVVAVAVVYPAPRN